MGLQLPEEILLPGRSGPAGRSSLGSLDRPDRAHRLDPRPEDEPIRLWARANGYLVNDRGHIPGPLREAYEASL
ncbi:Lsr2 family DNA-binding protein [Streptomyces goshikiensis]